MELEESDEDTHEEKNVEMILCDDGPQNQQTNGNKHQILFNLKNNNNNFLVGLLSNSAFLDHSPGM